MKLYLYYNNSSHRGPGGVVQNLTKGLNKIGVEVTTELSKADLVGCLQHPGNGYNKLPAHTVIGPNVFVLPNESPEIWNNFQHYIVPSVWVKNIYDQFGKKQIDVWPVGVDTDSWQKIQNVSQENDCFIYYKNRSKEDLVKVAKTLKQYGFNFKIIQYGNYDEQQLKQLCSVSKFAVILDDTESQGLAIQQIMSMDVPCLVWNKQTWEYNNQSYLASSIPYFSKDCGISVNTHEEFKTHIEEFGDYWKSNKFNFTPRKYVLENLSLEKQANEYVKILKKSLRK